VPRSLDPAIFAPYSKELLLGAENGFYMLDKLMENPPKSPFFKGGLSKRIRAVPPFDKGGIGGISPRVQAKKQSIKCTH
jgi:hypothetical protein